MNEKHYLAGFGSDKNGMVAELPVRELDVELTPKEAAKAANKLSRAEQLRQFEKDLEAHDSGNQPA